MDDPASRQPFEEEDVLKRFPAVQDDLNDVAAEYAIVRVRPGSPAVMLYGYYSNPWGHRWHANPSAREALRYLVDENARLASELGAHEEAGHEALRIGREQGSKEERSRMRRELIDAIADRRDETGTARPYPGAARAQPWPSG